MRPEEIIKKLNLSPLPNEGGYYRQTWSSDVMVDKTRPLGTAIYYLLINSHKGFSALHSLSSPEVYHFYLGDPVRLSLFYDNGSMENIILGQNILSNELPQFTVPSSVVQGSAIISGGDWALIGTTMAPGYTDNDFNLASRIELLKKYPDNKDLILSLTREEQVL